MKHVIGGSSKWGHRHRFIRGTYHRVSVGLGKLKMIGISEKLASLPGIRPLREKESPHRHGLRGKFGMGIQIGGQCCPVTTLIPKL
jgi:hypothetical protein